MVIGFLLFIILFNYLRGPSAASRKSLQYGMPSPERMAAYEEMWRREESDFWDWLDRRVGMHGASYPDRRDPGVVREKSKRHAMRSKPDNVKMTEREVDHAIRVTEEKLGVLKQAVQEKKGLLVETEAPAEDQGSASSG